MKVDAALVSYDDNVKIFHMLPSNGGTVWRRTSPLSSSMQLYFLEGQRLSQTDYWRTKLISDCRRNASLSMAMETQYEIKRDTSQ